MGGWFFVEPRLREIKSDLSLRYVGRTASASPATGSYAIHELEQRRLVDDALLKEHADEISAASKPEMAEKLARRAHNKVKKQEIGKGEKVC
jgi:2-oxoglutarate dehydrogenase E1 component